MPRFKLSVKQFILSSLLVFGLAACQSEQNNAEDTENGASATPVNVVTLIKQPITLTTELPARTVAFRQAEVRPQVNGIIEKRLFDEGADVEAGQQLYQIDAAPFEAALQMARAELARAEANLQSTKAREQRFKGLIDNKAISQQDYDDALAAFLQSQAEVSVAKANIETAQINLRYTKVNAPINGRIGRSNVTEGALVTAQQADLLATIVQIDPIYVDIAQPSKRLLSLRRQLIDKKIDDAAAPTVMLTLEDGSKYAHRGELQFSEVNVQESTGSIVIRALFPNPEGLLLPGMFVRAEMEEASIDNALLVPQRGVTFDREGNASAMIVNDNNQAEPRQLQIRREVGQYWLVDEGLSAGDRLIVSGLQKIAPEAPVEIDNNEEQVPMNNRTES
ncbi:MULTISPECIES: efflux RND transporter periplasmic adaptor subunit [unclassified Methylophaga]|jgi:membrane fusion protein (multidrug efflux system)|uniref:efflux RND transporter periplasmic adaptor subunit n=2 Tax=Methylophaga TaxID=40222 RepID=UPI000C995947|nr:MULTISPECIES: efflux RND transporter periplasmic adaptor subunit [unclassified Methylophaga]MAK66734.1 efflux transporter periplasmic adaptor subunit [Methylophaga sp.]MAY17698.1 efflux transporter periplasmic adaptor subunit [Methylophaga sp.]HCD05500.1 efflux transporter periplasmic adaptor subunit [Methylophaga sp.]|tara:strand:+ start:1910 stop:3088 length:1179 start_codon:yes stop_codon:yes gene_type:complete